MRYRLKTSQVVLNVAELDAPPEPILGPKGVAAVAREILKRLDADQEHFIFFGLNIRNRLTGYKVCASGGQSSCTVDPKIVFRNALLMGAEAIICVHNHPGDDPSPSEDDITLTRRLVLGGEAVGIRVLDHVIVTSDGFVSMQERGSM